MTFLFLCAAALCLSGCRFSVWNPAVLKILIIINVFHEGQMSNMTSTSSFCGSDYGEDIFTTPRKPQVCRVLFIPYLNVIRTLFSGETVIFLGLRNTETQLQPTARSDRAIFVLLPPSAGQMWNFTIQTVLCSSWFISIYNIFASRKGVSTFQFQICSRQNNLKHPHVSFQ